MSSQEIAELRERIAKLEARLEVLEKRVERSNYLRELYVYLQRTLGSR